MFQVVSDGPSIRQKFPEGGCTAPCNARLECGHTCQMSCHSWDPRHEEFKCRKTCGKVRPNCPHEHKCRLSCFKECGPCPDLIEAVLPGCGHTQKVKCGEEIEKVVCQEKCDKIRSGWILIQRIAGKIQVRVIVIINKAVSNGLFIKMSPYTS